MSANISKLKREDLIAKIKAIHSHISKDESAGELLVYLSELEKEIKGKKYGLVFEEHREQIDEDLAAGTPVLTENKDLFIDNGGQMNFLIEGDNLASLDLLQKTHKGKIDLIYIDPPYNTGEKDFIYDDDYVDKNDSFKHSMWLSFMKKRLEKARKLLSRKGVIFIQISDIEVAQLKTLCDSIFLEDNFVNIINVNMKNIAGASGGGEDKRFKKNCEYILVYAKDYEEMPIFNGAYEYTEIWELVERYKEDGVSWKYTSVLVDAGEKEYIASTFDGAGNEIKIYNRKNPIFKSIKQVAKDEGISEKEVYYKYYSKIFEAKDAQSSIRTRIIQAKEEWALTSDLVSIEYIPRSGRNKGNLYEQFYKGDKCRLLAWLGDVGEMVDGVFYKKNLQGTYWDLTSSINNLTKEGNVKFDNGKKPVDLLKRIISLYPSDDTTVLDFFAGSATTGHATIALNNEDEGTRKFILCAKEEKGVNIAKESAYLRLSNVINGYTNDKGKVFEPLGGSLKYYKLDLVPINEQLYYEYADTLLCHVRELVELENGINFAADSEIAIVLTDEEMAKFANTIKNNKKFRTLYLGHNVLLSEEQAYTIAKHNVRVNIIPDYYYRELEAGKR